MYQIQTFKNGLTLITINLPHLKSVTTLVAVRAGSRYETRQNSGISHFLEHMFYKGSKKYPTAEIISSALDSIGAINNAATSKEFTYYWIKSASKHINFASEMLSSLLKEPLLSKDEIEKERGVIIEENRSYQDIPSRYVWTLYERLQYGDQPLGWDIGGDENSVKSIKREDFLRYIKTHYLPKQMVLIYAGKLPKNISELAQQYFADFEGDSNTKAKPYKKQRQTEPKVAIYNKKTDQANLVLGVEGYSLFDKNRYAAEVLATILGEGMSSRLFLEVREKRGLAYQVSAVSDNYQDTGSFTVYVGLKLEKVIEGLQVIKDQLFKIAREPVTAQELKKAKEMIKGHIAIRSESTNFLATHFALEKLLRGQVESFDEYFQQIDQVTIEDVNRVAKELFKSSRFNLQLIGPFKSETKFKQLLES